jgi:hypothetical protein
MDSYAMFSPEFEGLRADKQVYLIDRGGVDRTTQKVTTQGSVSNSQVVFNLNPPSPATIISRHMMARFKFSVRIDRTAGEGAVFKREEFAPRANPISSVTSSMELTLNGQTTITEQPFREIQALQRYGTSADDRSRFSSIAPTYLDVSDSYANTKNGLSNPLGTASNIVSQALVPRGAHPYEFVTVAETDPTRSQTIKFTVGEWVQIGPFKGTFVQGSGGISNVQSMQLTYTFSRLDNLITRIPGAEEAGFKMTVNVVDAEISMYVTTPPPDFRIAPSLDFGIEQNQVYITGSEKLIAARVDPASNNNIFNGPVTFATETLTANNLQFSTIPKFVYIWVTELESQYGAQEDAVQRTDTALPIENISITFDNKSGILSSATKEDLYYMSEENGLVTSWPEFQELVPYSQEGNTVPWRTGIGSHLCLKFSKDIPLNYPQAVGMAGSWNFQVTLTVKNNRPRAVKTQINIMTVNDAILTVSLDSTRVTTGLVSSDMVVNSPAYDMTSGQVASMEGGARSGKFKNFFTSGRFDKFAEVGKTIGRAVAPRLTASLEGVGKAARGIGEAVRGDVQTFQEPESGAGLRAGGFREGAASGGSLRGGRYVSNAALKQRLIR